MTVRNISTPDDFAHNQVRFVVDVPLEEIEREGRLATAFMSGWDAQRTEMGEMHRDGFFGDLSAAWLSASAPRFLLGKAAP